jgi:hypothetical protein
MSNQAPVREPTVKIPSLPKPKNWPASLPYLPRPLYESSISQEILSQLHKAPASSSPDASSVIPATKLPAMPNSAVEIIAVTKSTHPAYGQHGLFAAQDLSPGEMICLYTGLVYTSPPADISGAGNKSEQTNPHADSDYDLSLCRELGISIDAEQMGNEARFVNDFRGVPVAAGLGKGGEKAGPNVEFRDVWIKRARWKRQDDASAREQPVLQEQDAGLRSTGSMTELQHSEERVLPSDAREWLGQVERCMALFVLSAGKKPGTRRSRGIRKGEELLVSYGKGFWNERSLDS